MKQAKMMFYLGQYLMDRNLSDSYPLNPLESTCINSYGKNYKIDLHVSYLLQSHRDILDTILSYGQKIQLNDESYDAGHSLTWKQVFSTLGDQVSLSDTQDESSVFDSFIDPNDTVLSISLYDIAKRLNLSPSRENYDVIENRIVQLSSVFISASEMNNDGKIVDVGRISFIKDFRFVTDRSKHKNKKICNDRSLTNHVFIVPDSRLLLAIADHGYFCRTEQWKMTHYKKVSVKSFIKFMTTNRPYFVNGKRLDWFVKQYLSALLVPASRTLGAELTKSLLASEENLRTDFGLSFMNSNTGVQMIVDDAINDNWCWND